MSWGIGVAGGVCFLEVANSGARVLLIDGSVGGGSTQRRGGFNEVGQSPSVADVDCGD